MNVPKISFIIPVYNTAQYIPSCLNSILNQTLSNIEIICIDDCSTDDSLKILYQYAYKDNRIKVIKKETSSGAGDSRNCGLKVASGDYIFFMDSDDWIEKNTCEEIHTAITKYDADICIFGTIYFDEQTASIKEKRFRIQKDFPNPFNLHTASQHFFSLSENSAWDKLYRRNFLIENNLQFQNLRSCNDVAFTYLSLSLAKKITYCNKYFYFYRTNTGKNISATRGRYFFNILLALSFVREQLRRRNLFHLCSSSFYDQSRHNLRYEYNLTPDYYKPFFLQEIKEFLPSIVFWKHFSTLGKKQKIVLTDTHILFLIKKKIYVIPNNSLLGQLLIFFIKLMPHKHISYKRYKKYLLTKYRRLTGQNLILPD